MYLLLLLLSVITCITPSPVICQLRWCFWRAQIHYIRTVIQFYMPSQIWPKTLCPHPTISKSISVVLRKTSQYNIENRPHIRSNRYVHTNLNDITTFKTTISAKLSPVESSATHNFQDEDVEVSHKCNIKSQDCSPLRSFIAKHQRFVPFSADNRDTTEETWWERDIFYMMQIFMATEPMSSICHELL